VCREALRDCHLRGIVDVQRLSRKLSAKKVTLQELCQLYMASNQLPALADALNSHKGAPRSPCLAAGVPPKHLQRCMTVISMRRIQARHAHFMKGTDMRPWCR
jgi:DNA mismatch repair ATPase MutS